MSLWPHLLRPWWLLLLPLCGWLLWKLWQRQGRTGRWQTLLPEAFHPWLLSAASGPQRRRHWLLLGLAWLLTVLALLGPSWQQVEQPAMQASDPLVVILELTPEMLASDLPPSRLEQARRKILDLLQERRDAQTGLVVYAGSVHTLVPLSNDLSTASNLLDALKPSIMPEPGRRADLAVAQAVQLLENGAAGQGRLLLISSGLSAEEQAGIRRALKDRELLLLGAGTPKGAPIALEKGGFLKDAAGNILVPRLDETGLRQFAQQLGGGFQRLRTTHSDLRALGLLNTSLGLHAEQQDQLLHLQDWADQGYWLLLPLLLLAACAGRRGWLFSLLLLLPLQGLISNSAQALTFNDLWLRADQQGQRLLEQQHPAEAAEHFEDFRWRGLALYQAGRYADAAQAFAQGDTAADHYNRGNALARQNQFEAAIDAYEQALEREPGLQAAERNKALLEELLRQQQEQQQQQQEQQSSENSSQNKSDSSKNQGSGKQGQSPDQKAEQNSGSENPQNANQDKTQSSSAQQGESQKTPPSGESGQAPDGKPSDATQQAQEDGQKSTDESGQTRKDLATAKPESSEQKGDKAGEDGEGQVLNSSPLSEERRQAMEQWLRQIPDDPSELLRRKFWYQQQQRQEHNP